MNIKNIEGKDGALLNALEHQGYSWKLWELMKKVLQQLNAIGDRDDIRNYQDFYDEIKWTVPVSKRGNLRFVISRIEQYALYGILPKKGETCYIGRITGKRMLPRRYRRYIDEYEKFLHGKSFRPNTFKRRSNTAIRFLDYLMEQRLNTLHKVSEQDILDYFYRDGRKLRGKTVVDDIRLFLRFIRPMVRQGDCDRIIRWLPAIQTERRPYNFFSDDEMARLKGVLYSERLYGFSFRDRAMMAIATYTGMRSCDIVALRFDEVDMENEVISFVQQKTGEPQRIPLLSIVGRAIYDYVKYERPKSDLPYIFLKDGRCGGKMDRLRSSSFFNAAQKIYDAAGISRERGVRGVHILRHNFAIALLNKGQNAAIIQSLLGHRDPSALQKYQESSYDMLKSCALSIEKWPVDMEIFNFGKQDETEDNR